MSHIARPGIMLRKGRDFLGFAGLTVLAALHGQAAPTTLEAEQAYAWSENTGWLNAGSETSGLVVTRTYLSGYAWSPAVGWINFGQGPSDGAAYDWEHGEFGVNRSEGGHLKGYAWGENIGWIRFHDVKGTWPRIFEDGSFEGYAWGENIGWIFLGELQRAPDNEWDGLRDALDPDDDNDRMPDAHEIARGFNPFDPADSFADRDFDGQDNLSEYLAGTDDADPQSVLRIRSIRRSGEGYTIVWESVPGITYRIVALDAPGGSLLGVSPGMLADESSEIGHYPSNTSPVFFAVEVVEE